MAVDRASGVDNDAEGGQEQPPSGDQRPDRPGSEPPGLSRADSRAGAAAANNMANRSAETDSRTSEARDAELKAKQEPSDCRAEVGVPAEQTRRWRTVAAELGEVRSYASFEAAREELGVRPGKELHHIVEQSQAKAERSGFSVIRINSTDNLVHLPADVHTEVSRHYSSQLPGTGMTIRDGLNGTTWDHQHDYGRAAIDDAWRRARGDGED